MEMTWKDILFWFDIYKLQSTEEVIVKELSYDSKGNKKKLPKPESIRKLVEERIKEKWG